MNRKIACVDREHCVACGCCVKACPGSALSVHKGVYAKIDEEKCAGCGRCAGACPAAVIRIVPREETHA